MKNSAFQLELRDNGTVAHLYDLRYTEPVDDIDVAMSFGSYCCTLLTDDLTKGPRPCFSPYTSREGFCTEPVSRSDREAVFCNSADGVQIRYALEEDGALSIRLTSDSGKFSEFGLNLPFNFMSKKNGTWKRQFLISSPYDSDDDRRHFCFMTRPDGNHLLVAVRGIAAGYKIDYSEYVCGHFFENFKYLASFDRAYGRQAGLPELEVAIYPVGSYQEALEKYQAMANLPIAVYDIGCGFLGTGLPIRAVGPCDRMEAVLPSGKTLELDKTDAGFLMPLTEFGHSRIIPYFEGQAGLECSVFALDNWKDYYERVTRSSLEHNHKDQILTTLPDGTPIWEPTERAEFGGVCREGPDFNLCESQIWVQSALRYMRLYGIDPEIAAHVKNTLYFVMNENPDLVRHRLNVVFDGKEYTTYKSTRLQEAIYGMSILIDAYRLFGERNYLEYAVSIGLSMIAVHQMPTGGILRTFENGFGHDYTTVTCLAIPFVDLANELAALHDARHLIMKDAAIKMADHVVRRGLDFPTEGGFSEKTNDEMEDGSMSASALTALYVHMHLQPKPEYLEFAKMILSYHDAWSIYTHRTCMFRSSLRWWETIWEGDSNGPALCCGHAWSSWRGESEFYYGLLAMDSSRLLDSYNTYMSNFACVDNNGKDMYSIYNCDYITGSAGADRGEDTEFRIAKGFPRMPDYSLSRYVLTRSFDSWFLTTAVIGDKVLNGSVSDGKLISQAPHFETLYVDSLTGSLEIPGVRTLAIRSPQKLEVRADIVRQQDGWIYAASASDASPISIRT